MGAVISRLVLASMVRRAYELTVNQREADAPDRLLPPALLNISRLRNDAVMRVREARRAGSAPAI